MMVLVVALVAIALAANPENRVLGLVSYAWAGFGAAFGPVVLFSVMWSRMTRNGALAGMVIGALTVIVWKQFGCWACMKLFRALSSVAWGLWSLACWIRRRRPACSSASPKRMPIIIRRRRYAPRLSKVI
ncbi:proline:sodium symporter PutP [Klebsiella aerogenes]|nr:proline:sodium symporter PutP [Klebsiella aerogenes]